MCAHATRLDELVSIRIGLGGFIAQAVYVHAGGPSPVDHGEIPCGACGHGVSLGSGVSGDV